jgi:hypothetical protein
MMGLLTRLTDVQAREHMINEAGMQLGRITGYYVALCGRTTWPASLAAPPGRPCPACWASPLL